MHLEANLQALETVQPMLAAEIRKQSSAPHIELMPIVEDIPSMDAVIVRGLPRPDSLLALLGSSTPFVILSHDSIPDVRSYLTLMDLRQAILASRISFAVGEDGVLHALGDIFDTLHRRRITLFGQMETDGYRRALKDMQFFDTLCLSNRGTLDQFAEEWQENISDNLKDILSGPFLEDQGGRWSEGEAVVVAAGPSLDEVDIPSAFCGAPVVACDTAVPALAMRGVTPDLIVTLDSSVSNRAYLQNLSEEIYERSVLCVTPLVSRQIYRKFSNVLFYSYGHPTLDHLRDIGLPLMPFASGGSVALTAVDIVRHMGVCRAYLIGFDFQYYRFRTHARGTGAALRAVHTASRFKPVETSVYRYQKELEASRPASEDAGSGRAAMTDAKSKKWRDWLEVYMRNTDLEIYQMSNNTAPIAGMRYGRPEGGRSYSRLNLRPRPAPPELGREFKFLLKELEQALTGPPEEIVRRIQGLPRVSRSLGYVLAWLSDKPESEAGRKLLAVTRRFRDGVAAVIAGQGR